MTEEVKTTQEQVRQPQEREVQPRERPSVRDSIKSAIKTETEKVNNEEETKNKKENTSEVETKARKVNNQEIEAEGESESEVELKPTKTKEKEVEAEGEVEAEVQEEVKPVVAKEKAVPGLPKEISDAFDKLPDGVQKYLNKTFKEVNDLKAETGRKAQHYRDIDTVLSTYEPAIKQFGVTPAQTVDRLFQWMNALAGPHKSMAIQQLAKNFGIDLKNISQPNTDQTQQTDQTNQTQNQQQFQMPPQLEQAIGTIVDKINGMEQQQASQRDIAAQNAVNSWAGLQPDGTYKNKPHYKTVQPIMFQLLNSGIVPLVNGNLDLDSAYDQACHANPEIRAIIAQEEADKQKEKTEQARKAALAKAKAAGVSIKTSAKSLATETEVVASKPKGPVPVRDSIRAAIKELNN